MRIISKVLGFICLAFTIALTILPTGTLGFIPAMACLLLGIFLFFVNKRHWTSILFIVGSIGAMSLMYYQQNIAEKEVAIDSEFEQEEISSEEEALDELDELDELDDL